MFNELSLPDGYRFHHIGYATKSIQAEQRILSFLGYEDEGLEFRDERQGVLGLFMTGTGPRIELLENLPGSNTLTPWITAGIKMYHFAFYVNHIGEALEWARARRVRIVTPPTPAVAFQGRAVAFVMFREGLLLEFIQS